MKPDNNSTNNFQIVIDLHEKILSELKKGNRMGSPWLTASDLEWYIGLKLPTVYSYVAQNRIPFKKIPGSNRLLFLRGDLDCWIENKSNSNSIKEDAKNEAGSIWNDLSQIEK